MYITMILYIQRQTQTDRPPMTPVPTPRAALGEGAFAVAWGAGRERPLEAAVAEALDSPALVARRTVG